MELLKQTDKYKIIAFDSEDIETDKDILFINRLIKSDIKYNYMNESETVLKIWNPKYI